AGILNLGILSDFIDRLEKGPMKIGVMDRNGTFIAHSVRSNVYQRVNVRTLEGVGQALSGIEGNYRVRERGKEVFLSVALVPQTGWPVVVIQTVDQAFAPVYKVRNYFWIGIGLALFLALIMALLRVKRIIKPLSRLISDAKKIEKGDYHFPPQPKSYPEIDELSKDLRMMANAVAGREETLQKLQEQMLHAKKMEAIGTLAGGIAHDFNNLLMGIQGNISLMLMDKEPGSLHYDRLRSMEQQVHRGAELTRQLLGFARGGKYQVQPTDLNELIRNQCVMFGRTRKEIAIHETLHKDLWVVAVDRGQIEQVLLNLFVNAWQAMPGGGNLFVGTENVTLGTDHAKLFQLTPGQYVHISVTDTGVGIDEDILGRIFDPFFTTKAIGKGTGLGLASAYGIIKNHDGIIDVHSEKGKGCTFDIYLPVTELKVEVQEPKIEKNLRTGDETILLVDDEDIIIDVGKTMLNRMGYNVLIAGNGEEAVEIIRKGLETSPPPDLTILDMIMPDMGGGETFDRLKEIAPDLKVLLSSGYNINGEAKEILARGCNGFIQKPFDIHALSLKIREVLDKRGY
ncbi:MAG TPA: ATP-binding protein, partial [Desulfobacteria bacterium]|nr:ATP-binding protein [Desulfobacteria bacterium]